MCGIAVLFEPTAPAWLPSVAQNMTRLVRHRGPDGEGLVCFRAHDHGPLVVRTGETPADLERINPDNHPSFPIQEITSVSLALGHRRLSILDLSPAGHQPMDDRSHECWITFNGEIYNYAELRDELIALGHSFRSGTDTEVVLAAYRQWGTACLHHFNGMFAFVLFDRRDRRLFAARDRFGVKPLYFWITPQGGLALASEIKQFTVHPGWRAQINGQRAYEYLHWGISDHTSETLFAKVSQFRGGEVLDVQLDELARICRTSAPLPLSRWYRVKPAAFEGTLSEAGQRFRELLEDSVRLRLRADVPVGSCLSGGLDSSSIVCVMRQLLGEEPMHRQKAFSAYSDVARFDERAFIATVAQTTGADARHVVPDPAELLRIVELITWHQDEPFGSTSIFAQWKVFELARSADVTVMLDGQGADETLGGYQSYFGPHLTGLLARGHWVRFLRERRLIREIYPQLRINPLRLLANGLIPASAADLLRQLRGHATSRPSFLDMGRLRAAPWVPHREAVNLRHPVQSLSTAQLVSLNLPMLLHWEDRDSMAHGVEARLPFLDYRLVEFALGLPDDFKLRDGWTKRVLREGMQGVLPESVRQRRDKLGFATAEEIWMRERHPEQFLQLLRQAVDASDGLLTPDALRKAQRILDGAEPFSALLWRFINFGIWLRKFAVKI
jgi:asparagine synthase (glutamine-hydrolysing)